MKRYFLVESNTDYESLFCYEMERKGSDPFIFERKAACLFAVIDRAQFFGNLNSLCVSKSQVQAPPIELKPADLAAVATAAADPQTFSDGSPVPDESER